MATSTTPRPHRQAGPAGSPAHGPRRRIRRALLVLGVLLLAVLAFPLVADAAVSAFAAHDHGTLDVVVDGRVIDLDQPRFHDLHPEFHIHPGQGNRWHHHPRHPLAMFSFERMTLGEALEAMGLDLDETGLVFDGRRYDVDRPGAGVTVRVDGAEVDPAAHLVHDGDLITVEVTTD